LQDDDEKRVEKYYLWGPSASRLDDDEKNTVAIADGSRGNLNMTIISEAELYLLILTSRKSEAAASSPSAISRWSLRAWRTGYDAACAARSMPAPP
jgi:hypothetical protein